MEAKLYSQAGAEIGAIALDESIFGIEPNIPVMHQSMVRQLANARLGLQNTRGRGELAGSTRKLFRQKGTGRARAGSIRASHRKGGGVAHGPHPRSYYQSMPRKMRRLAVRSALSAKLASSGLIFVDSMVFSTPRTKDMVACLQGLQATGKTLIVLPARDEMLTKSANNLPGVKTLSAYYLNVIDLLTYDKVIISQPSLAVIESYLSNQAAMAGEDA
ncbi:MAG: 50S ribosomal protein L4 [Chloroflexi bacterium]|jgi:large subunit ribosomal protein L4|nr:MAG: 50S ribosomal protein L4 [Chloroflexota bacterium]